MRYRRRKSGRGAQSQLKKTHRDRKGSETRGESDTTIKQEPDVKDKKKTSHDLKGDKTSQLVGVTFIHSLSSSIILF